MAALTYKDFQERIDIQDVLQDAGYTQNRRDGLRYPSYVKIGADGRKISGDKFIVTRNGMACFRPPEQKNYNVIGFIKSFPEKFAEYHPGMDKDRLVNLVCNRLLNNPIERAQGSYSSHSRRETDKPFDINDYELVGFNRTDWESQKQFYPFFKSRGISLDTQKAFSGHFFLASNEINGRKYANLCFPLTKPAWPGKDIIGMEQRGKPNAEGKSYKGMAAGSQASEGLWIGRLENHVSDHGFAKPLSQQEDVYWFESAFDAMAFYQIGKESNPLAIHSLGNAVYVSTGGNPSNGQILGMMRETPHSTHHLCFDNDQAGEKFCEKFKSLAPEGLSIHRMLPDEPHKDWNDQLLNDLQPKQQASR